MSIRIVFGKPGSGKSRYGVGKLIQELRETKRNIVTNLPLRLERLNEFLQQRYPDENLCCLDRITFLDHTKLKDFFKVRGPNAGVGGVAYFIDEAQIPFNARDWASADRGVFHYLTQHRHQGDDVWAFTQAPGNLDKQFRSLAQDFRRLRNERLVKLGIFRGFDRLTCRHFDVEPSGKGEPYLTETFQLDPKGIASCYDTSGGIGLQGGGKADIGSRAKGLTVGWGAAGLFVLASMVLLVPWAMGKATEKYLGKSTPKTAIAKEVVPISATPTVTPPATAKPAGDREPVSVGSVSVRRLVGVTVHGRAVRVIWSDGTVTTERDKRLESVESGLVVYDGSAYPLWSATQTTYKEKPKEIVRDEQKPVVSDDEKSDWKTENGVQKLRNPPTLATMGQTSFNR